MKMIIRKNVIPGSNHIIWYSPLSRCWASTFEESRKTFSEKIIPLPESWSTYWYKSFSWVNNI